MAVSRANRTGTPVPIIASNILVWISAVVVMGIWAYGFHLNSAQGSHATYELVVSILTVAVLLLGFFLGKHTGYSLLFNLIFSYLWIVVVAFALTQGVGTSSALLITVIVFSFIAFLGLFFNVIYDWHHGYQGSAAARAAQSTV